jgi:hypothetical protein
VENVNDELASGQESVGDKFARADGYWGVGLTDGKMGVRQHMMTHLFEGGAIHPFPPLFR